MSLGMFVGFLIFMLYLSNQETEIKNIRAELDAKNDEYEDDDYDY